MNRSELARQVAGETGLDPAAANAAVKAALGAVVGALARGEAVRLAGFGTFAARAARPGRNPATGAPIGNELALELRQRREDPEDQTLVRGGGIDLGADAADPIHPDAACTNGQAAMRRVGARCDPARGTPPWRDRS